MYRPVFLTSAIDGGEWSASRPGHFTPGETAPGTHFIGGTAGSRFGVDAVDKRKGKIPRNEPQAVRPVVCRYTDF
jgi:hypothetical protein